MFATMAANRGLVPAFEGALAVYDDGTARHSARVAVLADAVAERLSIDAEGREAIWWAATLHDLGKLGIPPEVVRKPGRLTADEWDQIRLHPTIGADIILAVSPRLEPVAAGIRSHHERWDGAGYPNGLAADGIPLFGRIIALADVFDSTTSLRPYRIGRFTPAQALRLIQEEAGGHFDPEMVPEFVRLVHDHQNPVARQRRSAHRTASTR